MGLYVKGELAGGSENARSPLRRGRGMKMRVCRHHVLRNEAIAARVASSAAEDGACGGYGFGTADDA